MAESEYSRDFVIFITADRGMVTVSNPAWIRMYDAVALGAKTIATVSKEIGAPRSSVQLGLSRMEALGILGTRPHDRDARKTLYYVRAVQFIRSIPPAKDEYRFVQEAIRRMDETGNGPPYDLLFMFVSEMRAFGLDLSYMFYEAGVAIGSQYLTCYPEPGGECLRDEMHRVIGIRCDFEMDVSSVTGIDMRFRSDHDIMWVAMLRHMIAGFVSAVVWERIGIWCSQVMDMDLDQEAKTLRVHMPVYTGYSQDMSVTPLLERGIGFYRSDTCCEVYWTGEGVCMVVNPSMNDIMRSLSEGPKTIQELSEEMGKHSITVHSIVSKLEREGMVERLKGSKQIPYLASACTVVSLKEAPHVMFDMALGSDADDNSAFRYLVTNYVMWMIGEFCIGQESVAATLGKAFAREVVERHQGIPPQEYVDRVCRINSNRNLQVKVHSYIPIVVHFSASPRLDITGYISEYLESFIREGLRLLTGREYAVSAVRVDEREE